MPDPHFWSSIIADTGKAKAIQVSAGCTKMPMQRMPNCCNWAICRSGSFSRANRSGPQLLSTLPCVSGAHAKVLSSTAGKGKALNTRSGALMCKPRGLLSRHFVGLQLISNFRSIAHHHYRHFGWRDIGLGHSLNILGRYGDYVLHVVGQE